MKISNIIKYTIGLPFLIGITLLVFPILLFMDFLMLILEGNWEGISTDILDIWRPII